ncbi:MAG TPA: glycosyltransferase family 4 protein [Gemmatimonadaceae bacterium]|nr:glycosyltransferase family 4 protein [Gemmatimonadaceae bacterium]
MVAPEPFFALRGTPINVREMARTLCDAGYEVHLATYGIGDQPAIEGLVLHRALSVPGVHHVPIGFSWKKLLMDALLALRVWGLLLGRRFDVVHTMEESVFFTMPVAKLSGVPVIYDMDSVLSDQLEDAGVLRADVLLRTARAVERAAVRHATLVITVCRALTERAMRIRPRGRIVQIEDCPVGEVLRDPDTAAVEALRHRLGLCDARVAVYTGNLEPYQGVDLLLNAFPRVMDRCPDARLLIVGGEPDGIEAARSIAVARSVGAQVHFAGKQPLSTMPEYMALADVLISPRRVGTNTPLKLFSYMYSGVPIIATDLLTHTQVLDHDTALLTPPTSRALGNAMTAVLKNPPAYRSLGRAARERVLRDYSPEAFARKLLRSYAMLLGERFRTVANSM